MFQYPVGDDEPGSVVVAMETSALKKRKFKVIGFCTPLVMPNECWKIGSHSAARLLYAVRHYLEEKRPLAV